MDRKFLRPGWIVGHLLVVLAVLVCLRLGRWQWHRMHEGGTIQNFGYAVLWPVFGVAFIYMWFRFLQLEKIKDAEDDAELTALAAGSSPAAAAGEGPAVDALRPMPGLPTTSVQVGDPAAAAVDLPPRPVHPDERPGIAAEDLPPAQSPDGVGSDPAPVPTALKSRTRPSTGVTVSIATVGDENDDPELAAYNRALAALAEKDHRRAH